MNFSTIKLSVTGKDSTGQTFSGDLILRLFDNLAPVTSARIVTLVNQGFYNGLTFHRILQGFVAQGGDPNGNGTGGDNFVQNGSVANGLFRFYGDVNGDGTDNAADFGVFRPAFGTSTGNQFFRDYLDINGDGVINAFDFGMFRIRFGASVP